MSILDFPYDVHNLILCSVPSKVSDGRRSTYDVKDLVSASLVCKLWRDICYSNEEQAPYVQLFRHQFSAVAPFPRAKVSPRRAPSSETIPEVYISLEDKLLGYNISCFKAAIECDYELCVADIDKKLIDSRDIWHIDMWHKYEQFSPIGWASDRGSPRSLEILLRNIEINLSQDGERVEDAVPVAIEKMGGSSKRLETLKILLSHAQTELDVAFDNCSPSPHVLTIIGRECSSLIGKKNPQILKRLLEAALSVKDRKSSIDAILATVKELGFGKLGNLYFHLLCFAGDLSLAQHLPNIPDPTWKDESGETLLDIAIRYNHLELINLFLGDKRINNSEIDLASILIDRLIKGYIHARAPEENYKRFFQTIRFIFCTHIGTTAMLDSISSSLVNCLRQYSSTSPVLKERLSEFTSELEELTRRIKGKKISSIPETSEPTGGIKRTRDENPGEQQEPEAKEPPLKQQRRE